jgi:hypothetical protein
VRRRLQFAPTPDQAEAIEAEAAATGQPIASVVREAVEQWRVGRVRARRLELALSVSGGHHSGLHDVAERHNEYFVMGIDEDVQRG